MSSKWNVRKRLWFRILCCVHYSKQLIIFVLFLLLYLSLVFGAIALLAYAISTGKGEFTELIIWLSVALLILIVFILCAWSDICGEKSLLPELSPFEDDSTPKDQNQENIDKSSRSTVYSLKV